MYRVSRFHIWTPSKILYTPFQTEQKCQYVAAYIYPYGQYILTSVSTKNSFEQTRYKHGSIWESFYATGFFQLHHGKPGIEGNMSHVATNRTPELDGNPLYFPGQLLERQWQVLSSSRESKENCKRLKFTFATYNVLAQNLLDNHMELYQKCPREYLQWEYRRENLCAEIAHLAPDMICLQEVEEEHYYNHFLPRLRHLGYNGEYLKRSGDKQDGCATFYNTYKFALDTVLPVRYNVHGVQVLDRDNVGLVLSLKPVNSLNSEARLCVANTHLLFNPGRGDIKLAQLQLLLAEIDRLAYISKDKGSRSGEFKYNYHPVLLSGDFNSLPMSYLYNFLRDGSLKIKGLPQKAISGQKSKPPRSPVLPKQIIPNICSISDQCQYTHYFNARHGLMATHIDTEEIKEVVKATQRELVKEQQNDSNSKHRRKSPTKAVKQGKRTTESAYSMLKKKRLEVNENSIEVPSVVVDESTQSTVTSQLDVKVSSVVIDESSQSTMTSQSNIEVKSIVVDESTQSTVSSELNEPFSLLSSEENDETVESVSNTDQEPSSANCSTSNSNTVSKSQRKKENKLRAKYCTMGSGTISHNFDFKSVYDHRRVIDGMYSNEVTTFHCHSQETVDYIFYSNDRSYDRNITNTDSSIALRKRLQLYTQENVNRQAPLPHAYLSSDHTILMAEFDWDYKEDASASSTRWDQGSKPKRGRARGKRGRNADWKK